MGKVFVSVGLSIYLTFVLGFLNFSAGLGTSLFLLVLGITLILGATKQTTTLKADCIDFILFLLLVGSLSFRSNILVNTTSSIAIVTFLVILALRNAAPTYAFSLDTLPLTLARFARAYAISFITVLKLPFQLEQCHPNKSTVLSIIVAAPFLILFHLLFSRVNVDYSDFVMILVRSILSIDLLFYSLQLLIQFALIHSLSTTRLSSEFEASAPLLRYRPITMALIPVCTIFALFSAFQSVAIAQLQLGSEFQILSQYVQRGFWELVWVAVFGITVWLVVYLRGEGVNSLLTTNRVTLIFASLCLLVGGFTLHKIGVLQYYFGFKDHRIYATTLTLNLIIALTCAVILSMGKSSFQSFFTTCKTATLTTTTLLAVINVDLVGSALNPIHFSINGVNKLDYSYLIGNSFDNTEVWESLMKEAISSGIEVPKDYYWGNYRPLCLSYPSSGRTWLVIKDHFDRLISKYSVPTDSLLDYRDFNIAEYRAYHWILSHAELLDKFYKVAEQNCSIAAVYYSPRESNFSINGY